MRSQRHISVLLRSAALFLLSFLFTGISCGSESRGTVVVQLRTDLVPQEEFEKVRLTLRSLDQEASSLRLEVGAEAASYVEAKRLGEFTDIPSGRYELSIAPYLAGTDTLASPYRLRLSVEGEVLSVTAPVSRSCLTVLCAESETCSLGSCLPLACLDETGGEPSESECNVAPQCALDEDCSSDTQCVTSRCIEGVCWYDGSVSSDGTSASEASDSCDVATEWCVPEFGCLPKGVKPGDIEEEPGLEVEEEAGSVTIRKSGSFEIIFRESVLWQMSEWRDINSDGASLGNPSRGGVAQKLFHEAFRAEYEPGGGDIEVSASSIDPDVVSNLRYELSSTEEGSVSFQGSWLWEDRGETWRSTTTYVISETGTIRVTGTVENASDANQLMEELDCGRTFLRDPDVIDYTFLDSSDEGSPRYTLERSVEGDPTSRFVVTLLEGSGVGLESYMVERSQVFNDWEAFEFISEANQDLAPGESIECRYTIEHTAL